MSAFDDVLGGGDAPVEPSRRPGRPTNAERERRSQEMMERATHQARLTRAARGETLVKPEEFRDMVVGRNWLGKAFGMDPDKTVKKRLANVQPHVRLGNNRELYLLTEIIPYLLKPKMDIASYIRTLNPTDMPASINKTFWEAERIKGRTLLESGELWHDSAVLDVLGRVFMLIKERIPIITEGMRSTGITDEQAETLISYADQMQADLYEALVEQPQKRRNSPRRAELEIYDGPEMDGASADFDDEDDEA
ncbi:MAG: hypothetical protein ABIS14_01405 [Sphingomonas sp.]